MNTKKILIILFSIYSTIAIADELQNPIKKIMKPNSRSFVINKWHQDFCSKHNRFDLLDLTEQSTIETSNNAEDAVVCGSAQQNINDEMKIVLTPPNNSNAPAGKSYLITATAEVTGLPYNYKSVHIISDVMDDKCFGDADYPRINHFYPNQSFTVNFTCKVANVGMKKSHMKFTIITSDGKIEQDVYGTIKSE